MVNLLSNAIKFTDSGSVEVRASRLDGHGEGAQLVVCVRDTGCGISEEQLPQLFKPFQQLDAGMTRKHDGTGLGLSICRRLARLMGGDVGVESQVGIGSTFTLSVPVERSQ